MDVTVKNEIVEDLRDLECCERCILYHLNADHNLFIKPQLENSNDIKKLKKNICRLCLDLLSEEKLDDFVYSISTSDFKKYNYNDFYLNVSIPKSIYLRQHSISIYLKEKYPQYTKIQDPSAISKIIKYSINNKIAEKLEKKQTKNSNFEINLCIAYEDDEKEIENVFHLQPKKFRDKKSPKTKEEFISRNVIFEILSSVNDSVFRQYFTVVPDIPTKACSFSSVSFQAAPLYIGGRYLKFGRDICQTPWILDDKKVKEHCLQDIVFEAVEKHLGKQDKMVFTASGREDADVRMLGNGRPFYIMIENPKDRHISKEQFRKIEEDIVKSNLVAVINFQIVFKSDIAKIKQGEESKKKTYNALCCTTAPDINEAVEKINSHGPVVVSQRTPLRVLHRRNQAFRERNIYHMKAKPVENHKNLFELELVTQAGTYVKEFVHGDFERTKPNLSEIVSHSCDIIALDVIDIDLEWPEINNIQCNNNTEK